MTKKDYKMIALFLAGQGETISKGNLVVGLSDLFKFDNPNFDKGKFHRACYNVYSKAETES